MNTKSEGVKDIVKWMEAELKKQKLAVEAAEKGVRSMGHFEDCGDFYHESLACERGKLSVMISWKVSTEKYMRKLRHQEAEAAQ